MSGNQALTTALKQLLKRSGITYAQAARSLELSEASVKRLFAEQSFTVQRMEMLCHLAGAEIMDLVRLADDQREHVQELSETQEREIAEDVALLLVSICVLNRYRFDEVLTLYRFDEHVLQQLFARLDRLGIIELLPGNRYRLNLSRGFRWRSNGPIQRYFMKSIASGFLDRKLMREEDHFRFAWGTISDETVQRFREKLKAFSQDFNDAADRDAQLPLNQRNGAALMLAFRSNWEPGEFSKHRR